MSPAPLMIDLFSGIGGWAEGGLAEGWTVVGFDIERHVYGEHRYPGLLVLQDVLTLHGSQFRGADLIVCSPPCQEFSWMAMPWSRAKQVQRALRGQCEFPENYQGSRTVEHLTALFDACFRIQREACEAAGRHIPMVVENVRGAQKWVGRARWCYGSYFLWGDVPALMPSISSRAALKAQPYERRHGTGSWFAIDMASSRAGVTDPKEVTGRKTSGMNWSDRTIKGQDFTRIAGRQCSGDTNFHAFLDAQQDPIGSLPPALPGKAVKPPTSNERREAATAIKNGGGGADGWFGDNRDHQLRQHHSKHPARKAASAMIAKIPFPLARHIAAVFRP